MKYCVQNGKRKFMEVSFIEEARPIAAESEYHLCATKTRGRLGGDGRGL